MNNNINKPVELVVFDIAGTTVKDNGEIAFAFQKALQEYGYSVPVIEINPLMGYKKTEAIKKMLTEYEPQKDEITEEYINTIHGHFLELMINHYSTIKEITALPHVEETFSRLKEKQIKIGLDTGFPKEITDIIIDRLGWKRDNKIDMVISSDEVKAGRPLPYMIKAMMEALDVKDPKKVIKVGDTEVDINEGKNAGCLYSIAVTSGAFTREELAVYSPSFIIDDLKELVTILENVQ